MIEIMVRNLFCWKLINFVEGLVNIISNHNLVCLGLLIIVINRLGFRILSCLGLKRLLPIRLIISRGKILSIRIWRRETLIRLLICLNRAIHSSSKPRGFKFYIRRTRRKRPRHKLPALVRARSRIRTILRPGSSSTW